jgi:hypothetical protein
MESIYFYKLTHDNGGAPCVQDGRLSLAICKPMIRRTAKPQSVIFGFAANSLHADNRLIYVARITDKVQGGDYFTKEQFKRRGDCIYERRGDCFVWRQGARHHGPDDLVHDLGKCPTYHKASVLLSDDFRYFGGSGSADYKSSYPLIKDAVEGLGRGHRVHHDKPLRMQLECLMRRVWNETEERVAGAPTSEPRRGDCHRSRSCGVLDDTEPTKR